MLYKQYILSVRQSWDINKYKPKDENVWYDGTYFALLSWVQVSISHHSVFLVMYVYIMFIYCL